jgi:hypothetical protein
VLTAALFATAKRGKQGKCPSTDEWVKKMWCAYIIEYDTAIKQIKFCDV